MKLLAIVPRTNYNKCDLCKWESKRGSIVHLREHLLTWHMIVEETAIEMIMKWKHLPPKERIRLEQIPNDV